MLILPIGLDKNEVRRTPWVTWVLIGSCFLVHLALSTFGRGAEQEAEQGIDRSLQYLAEHPYLSPPPGLLEVLGEDGKTALAETLAEWEAQGEEIPPEVAEQEQQELNRLTDKAVTSLRGTAANRLGFVPARPNPFNLVTYTLVHAGWIHLLGNMLFLFLTGPFIEDLYGRPLFAALYFVSGAAGAAAFAAGKPDSTVALVGASGAIAGVMGAFLVRLAARRIEFLVLPIPIIPAFRFKVRSPAFVVIPLWFAEQLYYVKAAGDSTVAFSAHIGGFAVGVAFAFGMALLRVEERFVDPAIKREISIEQNPAITRAADARVAGDLATARRLIDGVLKAEPANVDAWTERWEIGLEASDGELASQAGLRLIELYGRGPDRDMVWSVVNEARWRPLRMTSRFLASMADLNARAGDVREAITLYQKIAAEAPVGDVATLRALVSEGELLVRAGDQNGGRRVFDEARRHPACSEPWVERIERALLVRPTRAAGS
jgi:membrane associated rhomboid family serine protease